MNNRRVLTVAAFACGACAAASAADFPVDRAATDAQLDLVRGGYDLGGDLRASFALERTVLVNGMETVRTRISVPDIANITRDQATALSAALRTTIVTNGPGNVVADAFAPGSVGSAASASPAPSSGAVLPAVASALPSGIAPGLIVQNSLDNQAITATTTIDASVNTARMLENMRIADSIHDAVIQYRGN